MHTQMLRQGDAQVFKKYLQMKLQIKREPLAKLKALPMKCLLRTHLLFQQAIKSARGPCSRLISARLWIKMMVWGGNEVRKCFRINSADHVGA